jgi:hypothetical protein
VLAHNENVPFLQSENFPFLRLIRRGVDGQGITDDERIGARTGGRRAFGSRGPAALARGRGASGDLRVADEAAGAGVSSGWRPGPCLAPALADIYAAGQGGG